MAVTDSASGLTAALTETGTPSTCASKRRLKPIGYVIALAPAPIVPPTGATTRLASSTVSALPNLSTGLLLGTPIWKAKIGPVSARFTAIEIGSALGEPGSGLPPPSAAQPPSWSPIVCAQRQGIALTAAAKPKVGVGIGVVAKLIPSCTDSAPRSSPCTPSRLHSALWESGLELSALSQLGPTVAAIAIDGPVGSSDTSAARSSVDSPLPPGVGSVSVASPPTEKVPSSDSCRLIDFSARLT